MISRRVLQWLQIRTYFSLGIGREPKCRPYDHAVITGRISVISMHDGFSGTRLALKHPVDWSNYIFCPFEVAYLFLLTSTRNGDCAFLRHYLSQKYLESFEILSWRWTEKINWTDRVQNITILTQGRKENPTYKGTKATWIGHTCLLQHVTEGKI
jgi:hypothetical protein